MTSLGNTRPVDGPIDDGDDDKGQRKKDEFPSRSTSHLASQSLTMAGQPPISHSLTIRGQEQPGIRRDVENVDPHLINVDYGDEEDNDGHDQEDRVDDDDDDALRDALTITSRTSTSGNLIGQATNQGYGHHNHDQEIDENDGDGEGDLEGDVDGDGDGDGDETIGGVGEGSDQLGSINGTVQPTRWRVKVYRLDSDGKWEDVGTGHVRFLVGISEDDGYDSSGMSDSETIGGDDDDTPSYLTLSVREENTGAVLLNHTVSIDVDYQKQGETIITWFENDADLALSFQEVERCREVWNRIIRTKEKQQSEVCYVVDN